jgi:hypothetical protein
MASTGSLTLVSVGCLVFWFSFVARFETFGKSKVLGLGDESCDLSLFHTIEFFPFGLGKMQFVAVAAK